MTAEKVARIKGFQRQYEQEFGERLEIDWVAMRDASTPTIDELFTRVIEKHRASEHLIRSKKRLHTRELTKEKNAVIEFSKDVIYYELDYGEAAKKLNRDRSLIYYYGFKMRNKRV